MRLIPVIDLQHGEVVYAVGGQRDRYRQLQTPLSASATFKSVVDGLLQHFPSPYIYVADLDAIEGVGNHTGDVTAYIQAKPELNVWLDSGLQELSVSTFKSAPANLHVVVGTENFLATSDLHSFLPTFANQLVLSLDFRGQQFLGPAHILEQSNLWPPRVIVMTLDAVGKGQGPDFKRVAEIVEHAGDREVFAAGGVRSVADLEKLAQIGAAGALVASALHRGQIKTGDLVKIAGF